METRNSGRSGIGRIFCLSLNEALSGRSITASNAGRSSRLFAASSTEEEKFADGKPDQPMGRQPASDSCSRRWSACRQSNAFPLKKKSEISENQSLSMDLHKKSHNSNVSSSYGNILHSSTGKDFYLFENGISGNKSVLSSSRKIDSSFDAPVASSCMPAAMTYEQKVQDASPAFASQVHIDSKEMENILLAGNYTPVDASQNSGIDSGDYASDLKGHPRTSSNQSASVDSQKSGSSSVATGFQVNLLKSKSISVREKNGCKNRSYVGKKFNTIGENHGSKEAASIKHSSGKGRNRFKSTGYKRTLSQDHIMPDPAVFTNNRQRNYVCLSRKTLPENNPSKSTEKKENVKEGSQRSESGKFVNYSVEICENVPGVGILNAKSSSKTRAHTGHKERWKRCGPPLFGWHASAHHTYHLDSSIPLSDEADRKSGKPVTSASDKVQGTETIKHQTVQIMKMQGTKTDEQRVAHKRKEQGKTVEQQVAQIKLQTHTHDRSKEKPKVKAASVGTNYIVDMFSNFDESVSEMFDMKDDSSMQDRGIDAVQSTGSSVDISAEKIAISGGSAIANGPLEVEASHPPDTRSEAEIEWDAKISTDGPHCVSIAKMRQASVATRMRGNRRLKLGINRLNMNGVNKKTSKSDGGGMKSEDKTLVSLDKDDSEYDVGDMFEPRQESFLETAKQQTSNHNPSDHFTNEVMFLSKDYEQSAAEGSSMGTCNKPNERGNLNNASEWSIKSNGFISTEVQNSGLGNNSNAERNVEQEQQLSHRKFGMICEEPEVRVSMPIGQVSIPISQDSVIYRKFKGNVSKNDREEVKSTDIEEPVLLSHEPTPTVQLLNTIELEPFFARGQEQDCSDHCFLVEKYSSPLHESIGSLSSSYAPLSSINSHSNNLSVCSATSYTFLSSDDSKESVAQETGLSKWKDGGSVAGLRSEHFGDSKQLVCSSRHSFIGKHGSVAHRPQQTDSKHSKKFEAVDHLNMLCSGASAFGHHCNQKSEATVPIAQLAGRRDSGSQTQHGRIRNSKRNACTQSSTDQLEEAGTEKLSALSFQNDSQIVECPDRIAHESSTDTITESTQDTQIHFEVAASSGSSEPVPFCGRLDADLKTALEITVKTERSQVPASEFLHWNRTHRFRKHKVGVNIPESHHGQLDVSSRMQRKTRNGKLKSRKHNSGIQHSLEECDARNGDRISVSEFSNKGNNVSVRGRRMASKKVTRNQFTEENKFVKNKQFSSEQSHARLKEQEGGQTAESDPGSESSHSVSLHSDSLFPDSDLCLRESEPVKCRGWVKKSRACSVKFEIEGESDSQSDSNPCPSSSLPLSEGVTGAGQQPPLCGEELWRDSDCVQPHGTQSFRSRGAFKEEDLSKGKLPSCATRLPKPRHGQQKVSGQHHRDCSLPQAGRRGSVMQDSGGSQAATGPGEKECKKITNLHEEADNSRDDFRPDDRDSVPAHDGDDTRPLAYSHPDTIYVCKHTYYDVLGNMPTSDSSDYDIELLSQSDWDELPPGSWNVHTVTGIESAPHQAGARQSSLANASNEQWYELFQDPLYYPPYSPPLAQSCYAPYPPEAEVWVPDHYHYYNQWYDAGRAYSMGCYGYGFQDRDQGMDCSEAHRGQNCCSCISSACRQHSEPPPLSASQSSRLPSVLDIPPYHPYQDPRPHFDVSPIQPESLDSQLYFSVNRSTDPPPYFNVNRSNDSPQYMGANRTDSQQYYSAYRSTDLQQYISANRSSDVQQYLRSDDSETRDRVLIPACSGRDACSVQCAQDAVRREPAEAVSRPHLPVEMPMRNRREREIGDAHSHQDGGSLGRNMRNEAIISHTCMAGCTSEINRSSELRDYPWNVSGRRDYLVNGYSGRQRDYPAIGYVGGRPGDNPINSQPMNADGQQSVHCCFRPSQLPPHYPGSRMPNCRGDFRPRPGFRCPGFRVPSPAPHMDPFRFYAPPHYFSTVSPQQAPSSLQGGSEERGNHSVEFCQSEQQPYVDIPPFRVANLLQRDTSQDWNPRSQQSPLLMASCAPPPPTLSPPPPHPPPPPSQQPQSSASAPAFSPQISCPGPRETASQTSCSIDTISSEPCHLDSSFDTHGDYDASSSEQEDTPRAKTAAATKRKRSNEDFGKFVEAQRERYLQTYRDSGSDDPDSSSLPLLKQSTVAKRSSDQEGNNSERSGAPAKRSGKGVLRSLHRRAIPFNKHSRRSCPPVMESIPGASTQQGNPQSSWASGLLTPPSGLSCGQAGATLEGLWDSQSVARQYQENFPTLSCSTPSAAQVSSKSCSTDKSIVSLGEDGSCKNFFLKQSATSDHPSPLRGGKWPLSRYASRLMSDNRLSGDRWVREIFSKAYHTPFVDTHCHLDFLFSREPHKGSFASYRESKKSTFPDNYEGCVAVFCRPKSFRNESKWKPIVEEPGVWMAMGCHPKNATEFTDWTEQGLREALKHVKTVALGEIGLDYSKNYGTTAALQKEVFLCQIKIALEMNLPLVIHCREAEDDCLEILEKYVPADYKIHCHCFTSNYASATKWTSRFKKLFIGLTPLVTYRTAVETHQVARLLPLDRLLLETDAPYFFPTGFEGESKLSHPGMALTVAIRVAELRGISVEEVLMQVRQNTRDMYGI